MLFYFSSFHTLLFIVFTFFFMSVCTQWFYLLCVCVCLFCALGSSRGGGGGGGRGRVSVLRVLLYKLLKHGAAKNPRRPV